MNKDHILAKAVKDVPILKINKGDLLIFKTNYTLKDKGVYFFKTKTDNYFVGIYHTETKRFFVSDDLIPPKLEDVEILGEFQSKYIEGDL